jgi:nicotinamide-nucleotide amidase
MKKREDAELKCMIENIRNHTEKYIIDNKLKSLVIGISGGIDSALAVALLKPVCDKLKIPMIGQYIHIISNSEAEMNRAIMMGESFNTIFEKRDLDYEFKAMTKHMPNRQMNESEAGFKIRMGNVKARIRMIALYDLAQATGGLVLSTDNLTEYYLGFWTLHGDVGDFGPIQQLWKTEVYQIAEYLCLNELNGEQEAALAACIRCNATDGLGITSTDLDQIIPNWKERHSNTRDGYEEVDDILDQHITNGKQYVDGASANKVIGRYNASAFKRINPYSIPRGVILK